VEHFGRNGYIEESTGFESQPLTYALQRTANDQLTVNFENNKITMFMPEAMASEWTATDRVGFENNKAAIYLLIEKDFTCLDNVTEDQRDHYPNPLLKGS
jgi:hypothetical protein